MAMEKTFNAVEAEPRIAAAWEAAGTFRAGANASREDTFCIMIPPPNVNGRLHIGHAFNNTLQDILVRWHRMRGFDTLWQPGQDHAGIALQLAVEKELAATNRRRTDMSREEFLELAWAYKERTADGIVDQLKRLGASCDWSRNAFTMAGAPGDTRVGHENSPNFHDAVIKTFVELYDKGIIYRGKRLVNWDPYFESAISDLEVENIEVDGHMWHFKYPLADGATYEYVEKDADGNETLRETRDYISIATTRPETMLGDGAVAVHPSDERYAPIIGKLCEIPVGPKEHRRLIPIITDQYPDPDFGSGAVKITGAHDFNDYAVAQRGGIPMYRLMDTKGAMRADGEPYSQAAATAMAVATGDKALTEAEVDQINLVPDDLRGLDRFEARKRVVEQITSEGLAMMTPSDDPRLGGKPKKGEEPLPVPLVEAKKIMAPYGDRSKVVIEPMLTDQWFVDAEKIVGPALEGVRDGTTQILPEQHKKVYFNWLENIEPWTISRQLWWGHQIPVWYGPKWDEEGLDYRSLEKIPFCASTFEEASELAREHYGVRVVEEFSEANFGPRIKLPDVQVAEFAKGMLDIENFHMDLVEDHYAGYGDVVALERDPDVLDTWFSSGLWPLGTLGWPDETPELKKYFPTDVLVTGFDIIFFWVARMMMMQYAMVGQQPFDTVYVHALVRDEKGKKMSKSLGNVLDPLDLIDNYGADAVRFTLASMAAMGRDLKLSEQRIAGYRNFGTKLWNAFRFAEMNGVYTRCSQGGLAAAQAASNPGVTGTASVKAIAAATPNRWILGELARTVEAVDQALTEFRFNDAANTLYAFVWGRVCDWYLELAKPLFASENDEIVAETRITMAYVLDQCLILLHPFMPFITEELWSTTAERAKMCAHADWPDLQTSDLVDAAADAEMSWVIHMIEAVRSVRGEMNVPAGLRVDLLQLELDAVGRAAYAGNAELIQRLARIGSVTDADKMPKGSATIAVPGGTFCLPLADIINVTAEKARLSKSLGKLEKDIAGLNGRLSNPKFSASAPPEVVEETRELMSDKEAEAARLKTALDRLADVDA
ncbi:MAG: valine--tRNA ligase [Pseudomonadota bacterium]